MKNDILVKIEAAALDRGAVRLLRQIPGVAAKPGRGDADAPDVVLRAGDVSVVVELKAQTQINAAAAHALIEYARHRRSGAALVVVARTITSDARELLTEARVGWMDTTGAIHLDLPGLFVWKEGRARAQRPENGPKLSGKAGVATQALLREPERRWTIQEVADESNTSTGLVHRLFVRLENENLIEVDGAGRHKTRAVARPGPLLDLWAEEMGERDVHQLRAFRLARDPRQQVDRIGRALAGADVDYAITGAAAAARLAPFVTAVPVIDVWVREEQDLEAAARAAGSEPVTEGHNVVFRSARDDLPMAFRTCQDDVWLADPLRVFLDVRQDPRRGQEQARHLRQEVIGF